MATTLAKAKAMAGADLAEQMDGISRMICASIADPDKPQELRFTDDLAVRLDVRRQRREVKSKEIYIRHRDYDEIAVGLPIAAAAYIVAALRERIASPKRAK